MTAVFAVTAAVLFIARLGIFIALHIMPSDYSIVRHAFSDYAVGRTRPLTSAMTWVTAAGWATLAVAVITMDDWPGKPAVYWQLIALALVFLVLPFLPTDLEGGPATTVGRLHLLAAIIWFALSYSLTGNFAQLLATPAALGIVLGALHWIALVSLVVLVVSLVLPGLRKRSFGISERVFILAITLFYGIAALGIALG